MSTIRKEDYINLLKACQDIDLCEYCLHHIPCKGKECPKFIQGVGDVEGKFPDFKWTCEDFDFGTCPMLEGTPCQNCFADMDSHFEWSGKIFYPQKT